MKSLRELYYSLPRLRELAFSGPPLQRWREKSVKSFIKILKESGLKRGKLLEVGCGAGFLSRRIGKLFPQFDILAIDLSPELISWATRRNKLPNVRFECKDFLQIEGKFDVIMMMEVLPVVGDHHKKFVEKMHILLNDGGLGIVTHLRPGFYPDFFKNLWRFMKVGEIISTEPESFLKMVEIYGFSAYYYSLDYLEGKYIVVMRRGGRVDEGARFEIAYPRKGDRGFESHPLRHNSKESQHDGRGR